MEKRKTATSLLVGAGMLALSGAAGYAQIKPSAPGKMEQGIDTRSTAKQASGEVTAVDAKTGKLSVKTTDQDLDLKVQGGLTKKSLESIKVGDKVTVSYREQGANLIADSVHKSGGSSASSSSKARR